MKFLNVTHLTPEQLKKLSHYRMLNYDSLQERIQKLDENYPYYMPTWLIILITVLSTLIGFIGIALLLLQIQMNPG